MCRARTGHYGKPGHRRQRYRCHPFCGKWHRFVAAVPRYGLIEVGRGESYRAASARVRTRANRHPEREDEPAYSRHGQLDAHFVDIWVCEWHRAEKLRLRWEDTVRAQLDRRPTKWQRERGAVVSSAGLDRRLNQVRDWLTPRRNAFGNRDRLSRRLMLMQLQLNDRADETRYAGHIRDWLEARQGDAAERRLICEPTGWGRVASARPASTAAGGRKRAALRRRLVPS